MDTESPHSGGPAPAAHGQLFLVEHRLPAAAEPELQLVQDVLVEVSRRFTARGVRVHYLGSMFLPRRDRLLSLFAAGSIDDVRPAIEAALVPFSSIEPVRELPAPTRPTATLAPDTPSRTTL